MVHVSKELERYLSDFEQFEKNRAGKGPSWVSQLRKTAISRFAELGFPTTRHEEWKYTNVAPLVKVRFQPAAYELDGLTAERLARTTFREETCAQLVFVNGYYSQELSFLRSLPDGVQAGSLAAAVRADPRWVEPYLAQYAGYQDHAFVLSTRLSWRTARSCTSRRA